MNRNLFNRGLWGIVLVAGLWGAVPQRPISSGWKPKRRLRGDQGTTGESVFRRVCEFLREERGDGLIPLMASLCASQDPKRGKTDVPLTKQVNHFCRAPHPVYRGGTRWSRNRRKRRLQDLRKL